MDEILRELQLLNGQVTSQIIKDLIAEHSPKREKMISNYNAYRAKDLPILYRVLPDETKINSKLVNDYRGEIVDQGVGYLFGKPVTYQLDGQAYDTESALKQASVEFENFKIRNNIEDLDAETGKKAAICGYAARLCYVDRDGKERIMNVDPWECIFITDGSIDEPQYAMRYYKVTIVESGKKTERYKVEWYDNKQVSFYFENSRGDFVPDETEPRNPLLHTFDFVPLIEFPNNEERMNDFEKVESLINAYDRVLSDSQNEIEEFRLAYMIFYGAVPDVETIAAARQTGAFGMPAANTDEGGKVEFLTKQINDTFLENHKKTLKDNIYRFAKTVDMSDEKFSGGDQSGESRKWKLLALENKAIIKERKFSTALRQMFKVLASAWQKKSIPIDYLNIYWDFKRNIPVELKYEAEITTMLQGRVSEKTRLGLLSFIDDPEWELQQMQEERLDSVDLDAQGDDVS